MSNSNENLQFMRESYDWISRVGRREISLTDDDMSRYFTDDVRMVVDNVVKASGINGLRGRFEEMLESTSRWEASIMNPVVSEDDKVAAYGQYHFVNFEGTPGVVHTCSIWTLTCGRISEIFEVASFQDTRLDLADHGAGAGGSAVGSEAF